MFYKLTMIVRPKYNHRQAVEDIDGEFQSLMEHYGAESIAHEITQGYIIVEECVREQIYKDETVTTPTEAPHDLE